MTIEINDAQRYAETIAEELRLLDSALQSPDSPALAELFGDYDEEDIFTELDVLSLYVNNLALDLSVRRDTRGAEYGSTIEITRTIGGPGCWIRRDTTNGDWLEVTAAWGGSRGHVELSLNTLSAWLDELAAML